MKARLVLEQYANMKTMPPGYASKVKFRSDANGKAVAVYPVGTEFEGEHALLLCKTGQAEPADDECAQTLGMTAEQRQNLQLDYKMNTLGIYRAEDRELYRAGVIEGYDAEGKYKPGPNWAAYQEAKAASDEEDDV